MATLRVFDFQDYKRFALRRIEAMPNGGRGQMQKLARFLSVHPTLVSQVFRGPKNLTSEQACKSAEYFGLSERESDFFLALVERERAGSSQLKAYWQRRLDALRDEDRVVVNRIAPTHRLTPEQRVEFYSSWEYSASRLATSIPQYQAPEAVAERLGLTARRVGELMEFLVATGLCVQKQGRLEMGAVRTHIPAESPLASRHHLNWRLKALEAHSNLKKHELAFSAPVSIARKERDQVRDILLEAIEKLSRLVSRSDPPEELSCLNIDWFDLRASR